MGIIQSVTSVIIVNIIYIIVGIMNIIILRNIMNIIVGIMNIMNNPQSKWVPPISVI